MHAALSISQLDLVLRLCVAVGLCGLIGLEREARDQVAGLRTHILVGVGSALFTLVSAYGFDVFALPPGGALRPDPTRIAAQIVSGIGFLGAGAIIRQGFNVRGVTTAAALWISAAVGMAAGAGYYLGASATTVIVLVALIGFRRVRAPLIGRLRSDHVLLDIEMTDAARMGEVFGLLASHEVRVVGMTTNFEGNGDPASLELELRFPPRGGVSPVLDEVLSLDSVSSARATGRHVETPV